MKEPAELDTDPSELRFRLDSVPAGAWVSFGVCCAGLVYAAAWTNRHEDVLVAMFGAGALGAVMALALPWERIVRSRWREAVFTGWTILTLALILAAAAVAGGGDSVFATLSVVPIVFSAVSYPRRLVAGISVAVIASYVGLAVATGTPGDYTLMFVTTLTATALMAVWQARNHERRRELLAIASRTDPLTGALNRRGFEGAFNAMLASVTRLAHPAALVLLDLDDFKRFNDAHGHVAGDELLCWVVERIRGSLRPTDSLARMGGDEFAVLLAGADRAAAHAAVRRIADDLGSRVHASWGIASAPVDGDDIDVLYRRADAELYEVKRGHDDGVVVTRLRV